MLWSSAEGPFLSTQGTLLAGSDYHLPSLSLKAHLTLFVLIKSQSVAPESTCKTLGIIPLFAHSAHELLSAVRTLTNSIVLSVQNSLKEQQVWQEFNTSVRNSRLWLIYHQISLLISIRERALLAGMLDISETRDLAVNAHS